MDKRETFGAFSALADDERGDLNDLTMATGGGSGVLARGVEMTVRVGDVSLNGR